MALPPVYIPRHLPRRVPLPIIRFHQICGILCIYSDSLELASLVKDKIPSEYRQSYVQRQVKALGFSKISSDSLIIKDGIRCPWIFKIICIISHETCFCRPAHQQAEHRMMPLNNSSTKFRKHFPFISRSFIILLNCFLYKHLQLIHQVQRQVEQVVILSHVKSR